jgi:ABC-type multidrug transport system fused ATPase/permease subunit
MKLLLKAALKSRKHFGLAFLTLISLLILTVADQMEMFSLGVMANSGVDFFTLFGKEKKERVYTTDKVSKAELLQRFDDIDVDHTGIITKEKASFYMAKKGDTNPIKWFLQKMTAKMDLKKNFQILIYLLLIVALFKATMLFFSRYTTRLFSIRVTRDLRLNYFEHIQTLSMGFYTEHNIGSLSARVVGDAGQIASSLHSCLTNYIHTPFKIVTTLGVCFYLSWQLSCIIFIGLPLIVLPVIYLTKRVKRVAKQLQKNQETFSSVLLDFLAGIHTIKIFAVEAFSFKKYKEQNDKMARLETKSAKYDLLTRPVLHTVTTACLAFVCLFGLHHLSMSIAELIVFCGLLHLFYEPVKKFAEENANIQRGVVAAERMFEVLSMQPHVEDPPNAQPIEAFDKEIQFDHVYFAYKEDYVLKDFSFRVKKGETVALVGPTGAGKSTIVQLLPRLYNVQKGSICIDGTNIADVTQKSLRNLMAFVPQKPFLFYDTVAENISFGLPFSREEIIEAAKKAHAHEFIQNLPDGYDTLLAETGKTLSGGQQQRLAIARALLKNSPILVLDEATSSLDAVSEQKIQKAINELHGSVTQIIIAHRLSTIEHADRIVYIDEGQKIAEGTKEQLLQSCPAFKIMWDTYHQRSSLSQLV